MRFLKSILLPVVIVIVGTTVFSHGAAYYYFDANGSSEGSGGVSGSFPWTGSTWSTDQAGTSATGTLPTRESAVFSAGTDGYSSDLTVTGASGEMGDVIVQEGYVTIQNLSRIFTGGSSLKTAAGTSLTIQNSPDFYNNTVYLETAENSTLSLGGAESGVRNAKLVKTGSGLAVFNGANNGSSGGSLTVNEGELRIRHSSGLPNGTTVVNAGGMLAFSNSISPARGLTLAGGTLCNHDGTNTCLGSVTLTAASFIDAALGALTLNASSGNAVSGAFPLRVSGSAPVNIEKPLGTGTSLNVVGPGTVTLSSTSPLSGAVTVTGGTLRFTENFGVLGGVGGSITVDGALEVANDSAQTMANTLFGGTGGRFIKQGGGSLTLTATNPFGGQMRVDAGTLTLGPAAMLAASRIETAAAAVFDLSQVSGFSLASGQTLAGSGTVVGAVTAAAGSVIDPGQTGLPGTLAFSEPLNLNGDVTVVFDLATTPGGTGDQIAVAGDLSLAGANTIRVAYTSLANGSYPLVRCTGGIFTGELGSLRLEGFITLTQTARLQVTPAGDGLDLVVEDYIHTPRDLVWTGDGSADLWQNGGAAVWSAGGQPAAFAATDRVLFDATGAASQLVTLSGELVPASVTVNAATDYIFTGSGRLLGPASLLKSGGGRQVIDGDHAFTGGTTIASGCIEVRSRFGLGTGAVENSDSLEFAASQPIVFSNLISGIGGIVQLSGTTTLTAANTFTGPLNVAGGTLRAGHVSALGSSSGGTTVAAGATLDLNGFAINSEPVTLQGGVLANNSNTVAILGGTVTLDADAMISGNMVLGGSLSGGHSLTKTGADTLALDGASTRTGLLSVSSGGLLVNGTSGPGPIAVAAGASFGGTGVAGGPVRVGGTLAVGASVGTLTIQNELTLQPNSTTIIKIHRVGTAAPSADVIAGLSRITFGGALVVNITGTPLVEGDTFPIFQAAAYSGGFASIQLPYLYGDLLWDTSTLASQGILRVIKLPAVSSREQRRDWMFTRAVESPGSYDGSVMAAVYFACGEIASGTASALSASRTLLNQHLTNEVQINLFEMWPAMDLYIRYGPYLDDETKANIRQVVTTFTQYDTTNTSNLQTLAWVTRYLGSEAFGESAFIPEAAWRVGDPSARSQLLSHMSSCAISGFGEHASRPYYDKNLLPILSVGQLSGDPAMSQRGLLAYEAGLAQNAGTWMRGHLGVSTSRSYPDVLNQFPVSSLGLLWFHFGGEIPPGYNGTATLAAVMNPPVSPILETAAKDRSTPFTARQKIDGVHQTSFLDRDYVLFSDGPKTLGNFQVYPNGVVWCESNLSRYSFLWVAKPWVDDSTIYVSHPHGRNTGQYKEAQTRDAALYIYDIPASGDAFPYALGYVPGAYRAVFNESAASGHIFLHYGTVLIAIRSEIPFSWDPQSGIAFPASAPKTGDSEFRIYGTRFSVALETGHPADFPGATPADQLAAFRSAVLAQSAPARTAASTPTATYTTRRGDNLAVTLSADPTTRPVSINSVPVNFNVWPVLENPWMCQRAGDSLLTLFTSQRRELLDFSNWTRRVQTAPSAIAPVSPVTTNTDTPVDIDLAALSQVSVGDPLPLRYSIAASSRGSVVLQPDGHTARFTPDPGYGGEASFEFSARAAGVDPSRLVFLYDYEDDYLANNWIADVSGHRLTGILSTVGSGMRSLATDVPSSVAGVSGLSLQFDESGNSAARFTHDLTVTEHDMSDADWTFATWARRATTTNHDMVLYFGSGDGFGGSGDEFYLFFPAGSNTVRLHHYNAANALDLDLISPATATAGAWHHLAVSFTRNGLNTGIVRLYLNDELAATSSPVNWAIKQSSPMVIGGNNSTTGSGPERWFNGRLDDTALFNRVLTAPEIAMLASQSVRHFTGLSSTATVHLNVLSELDQWWLENFGTTENTGDAADDADPDSDGLQNLIEYALGTLPNTAASRSVPEVAVSDDRLTLRFVRSRGDVTYIVEGGSDLANWSPVATNPGIVGQSVTVTDTVDISTANPPRRFLRLRVTNP